MLSSAPLKLSRLGFSRPVRVSEKKLAALIPAILSGKKVVVSTNTIALQEQYINKDIPALKAILSFEFEAGAYERAWELPWAQAF